ncbi:MAG: anaerobic sulfite reductase subunit B [Oscillospiraceae bacterium]|nr:anaerobic sulfite reductase subunit B [Oscillospiraceae bacterium]
MVRNDYIPFPSEILEVIKHTDIEYTFRMAFRGKVKPGQFFEVSIPKYGEAPISVSGIGDGFVDLTIRRVGRVTNEVFEHYVGNTLLLRGPYGNGFDLKNYKGKELVIIAGGTGVSPVRGVISHFAENEKQRKGMTLIAGFKSANDILFKEDFRNWRQKMDLILTLDSGEETAEHKIGLVTKYIPDLKLQDVNKAVAIVVGPPAMMRFSVNGLLDRGFKEENIWVSYERKMCCGLGKCGHCRINDTYICLDGPVFNYTVGKTLID